jgi:hypothetical protein
VAIKRETDTQAALLLRIYEEIAPLCAWTSGTTLMVCPQDITSIRALKASVAVTAWGAHRTSQCSGTQLDRDIIHQRVVVDL